MALKPCKECKKEVSAKAKKCPHCGVSNPTVTKKQSAIKLLSLFVIIGSCTVISSSQDTPPTRKLTAEEQKTKTREEQISKAFSAWDGAHIALERMIKNAMNDPDSYEHIQTRYNDNGKTLFVGTEYRGRNGFGGMVKSTVKAITDVSTGEVIEIVAQE